MKILLLAPEGCPLAEILSHDNDILQTDGKVTPEFVRDYDFLISYGYRHILKKDILDLFPGKAINLHISYLPYNRGADPNFWAHYEGAPSGVTIHYMDEGIDTGDIITQSECMFSDNHTLASTYDELHREIVELFEFVWPSIKDGTCGRSKQEGHGSYHNSKDKDGIFKGWDTPIRDVIDG